MLFTVEKDDKSKSFTVTKTEGDKIFSYCRPFYGKSISWRGEIAGLKTLFNVEVDIDDRLKAIDIYKNGEQIHINSPSAEWKLVYLQAVDALLSEKHKNMTDKKDRESFLSYKPAIKNSVPAEKTMLFKIKNKEADFLEVLHEASYGQARKLGYNPGRMGLYDNKTITGLKVIQCACGRCWIGPDKPLFRSSKQNRWTHCGCLDNKVSAEGIRKAAWREYCTIKLALADPKTTLHGALVNNDAAGEDKLPPFEHFRMWYYRLVDETPADGKGKVNTFLHRIDGKGPFSIYNLTLEGERPTFSCMDEDYFVLAI